MLGMDDRLIMAWLMPGLLSLLCAADGVVKFGLHADNMKFNTQNKD
jgi:hypothetical protein